MVMGFYMDARVRVILHIVINILPIDIFYKTTQLFLSLVLSS